MALSNAGVAARAARDEQQRAASGSGPQRLADSAAALERKAALYERLARGEVEDEAERYEVGRCRVLRANDVGRDDMQQQQLNSWLLINQRMNTSLSSSRGRLRLGNNSV
jgi:hypothetical protein